ncbi:MAG: isopenicillin N synthase family oxygenase [Gammaproteobacteria bacterium]|nr:isopenicillin N synthase family oxygenase [Gammaproteobacteria bacterium]
MEHTRTPPERARPQNKKTLTPARARSASGHGDGHSSLPVIDIGPLFGCREAPKRGVAEQLGNAARNNGFFYIKHHNIDPRLIDAAYSQAEGFFALRNEDKVRYYIGRSANHRGYVPVTEKGSYTDELGSRRYEAFDLALDLPPNDPDYIRGNRLLGPNIWPDMKGFRESITDYYDALADLGRVLCRGFEICLKLPQNYLDQYMTKPTSQLRLIHYLENRGTLTKKGMSMGAHTDYECFTVLHQRQPGLQVLNAVNQWVEAWPIEGTFLINIGDMLEAWTNGLFKSTLHRVVNRGHERFSMPFFVAANYDAVIEPLEPLVTESRPAKYASVIAGEHLLGQLLRDFPYLRKCHEAGKLDLSFEIPKLNPFEQRLSQPSGVH